MKFGLFLLILTVLSANASTTRIWNFNHFKSRLESGASFTIVSDYNKCIKNGTNGPDAIGMMQIHSAEYFGPGIIGPDAVISFSENVFINHPSYGIVYNYVKFRVSAKNTAQVTAQYIDPLTLKIRMNDIYNCRLTGREGPNIGVMIYEKN
jgi:hypothetical protein